jgi:hypothetical protein
MPRFLPVVLALIAAPSLLLGQATVTEKILLPVVISGQLQGAYGSLWETRLSLLNIGTAYLRVDGIANNCRVPPCVAPFLAPNVTVVVQPDLPDGVIAPGYFLFVDASRDADLAAQLRVQDVSRQSETWGTEIPVIRESEARTSKVELLDIPVDNSFRSLARFYDFDPLGGHALRLRLFRTEPTEFPAHDDLVLDTRILLQPLAAQGPGYAELSLWNLPQLPTSGRLRLEVIPETEGLRFWAIVSVTDNATQHVTILTPQ